MHFILRFLLLYIEKFGLSVLGFCKLSYILPYDRFSKKFHCYADLSAASFKSKSFEPNVLILKAGWPGMYVGVWFSYDT